MMKSVLAWLIEFHPPNGGAVLYLSNSNDWCCNASHGLKFSTAIEAHTKMITMTGENLHVAQHAWQAV